MKNKNNNQGEIKMTKENKIEKDYDKMTLNQLENEFIIGLETLELEDESETVTKDGDDL